ncbi:hypothetical protein BD408DRAFT_427095 [Parasitella parasitica]|nr:hypothetical protein BD408DRAFT_427095 [Parasitella parasitica]
MAGFKNKPFHLERNIISPSIDLQRKIFPWIESVYGVSGSKVQVEQTHEPAQVTAAEINKRGLQEFEGLVPEIINAQRELSGSTLQIDNQILRTNQHFDNQFAFMMHTINSNHRQEVEATDHHNSLLNAMSFQLQQQDQQIKKQQAMIQTMLTSQQFLTSLLQLALAGQGSNHGSSAFVSSPSAASASLLPAALPSASMPPAFVPSTFVPFVPAPSSRPLTPLRIRPTPPLMAKNRRTKGKGKAKDISFIPYQPEP